MKKRQNAGSVNPTLFMLGGQFYLYDLGKSIYHVKGVWFILSLLIEIAILVFSNTLDSDQTLHSAVSGVGLQCFIVILWDTRQKLV